MAYRLGVLVTGATFSLVVLAPAPASAFCRTRSQPAAVDDCKSEGPSLYWKNRCVGFTVSQAASEKANLTKARSIVGAAYTEWTKANATCTPGIRAIEQEPTKATAIGFNKVGVNENAIVFRDDVWPYDDAGNPLALTTVTFNAETGEILDADIEINTADRAVTAAEPLPAQGYDLQSIITHEVGHFLGLAHTRVNNATMESRYDRGQIGLRSIEEDDRLGLCAIYPSEDKRTTDLPGKPQTTLVAGPCDPIISIPPPADTQESTCLFAIGSRPSNGAGWLTAAGLVAGAALLRRRRR